jgi:hypothetical protein
VSHCDEGYHNVPLTQADRSHLRAWFDVVVDGQRLGGLRRSGFTTAHVNKAIAQWQTLPSPHAIRKVRVRGYDRPATAVAEHAIAAATVRMHARRGRQAGMIASYTRKGSVLAAHTHPANSVQSYEREAPATSGVVVSALTIRHRCRILQEMYRTLDGKKTPTPVDEAKSPKRPKTPPVTVPAATIEATLRTLTHLDRLTYARFAVANTCAQRPCQVGRARPEDVDVIGRTWLVRDAKGEAAHTITLDDPQVAAWEVFIVADAWGMFDTTKYGRIIHAAGWPRGIRPYAARHSFAVNAIRSGVSLGDLQGLLGHADPSTTRRFYAPFQIDRQRVVSAAMKNYLANVFKLHLVK